MINISDTNHNIIRKYLQTNDSGHAKVKVSQRFLPIIVKVYFAGYEPLEILVNESKNYDLNVILKGYISYYYKEDEIKRHRIQILDSKSFRLENYYDNFEWSTFYKE